MAKTFLAAISLEKERCLLVDKVSRNWGQEFLMIGDGEFGGYASRHFADLATICRVNSDLCISHALLWYGARCTL